MSKPAADAVAEAIVEVNNARATKVGVSEGKTGLKADFAEIKAIQGIHTVLMLMILGISVATVIVKGFGG